MINRTILLSLFIYISGLQQVNATTLNFDLTFDGTSISVDGGSDIPAASTLAVGDSFNLNLITNGDDFWRVDGTYNSVFLPLTFAVSPGGDRTANVESVFFLDGDETARITETGILQRLVHIGANSWTLATGLEFDTVSMAYTLLTSTVAATTIQNSPDIFSSFSNPDKPFFRSSEISYISAVPLPAALPLFAGGLALIGWRRKK